jgi:type II secretory pathway pseudopilin PulG
MVVFLLVIAVTAITLQWTVRKVWEHTLHEQIERDLKQKTQMFAYRVEADRQHTLADITSQEGQAAGARATVIDPTGKVLADSEADPSTMENHAQRKELPPLLKANSASINVPATLLGLPSSMWPPRFLAAPFASLIPCPTLKSPPVLCAAPCYGARSLRLSSPSSSLPRPRNMLAGVWLVS